MQRGFSLIELMITLIIIAILSAIAIPAYQHYTERAYFSELVMATQPFKLGVAECFTREGSLDNCNAGQLGIPPAITSATGAINNIDVNAGIITASPTATHGLETTDTYMLSPSIVNNTLQWLAGGEAITKGLA